MPAQTIGFFVITGTKTTSLDIETVVADGDPPPPHVDPVAPTTEVFTGYMTVNTTTGSVLSCSFGPFESVGVVTPPSELHLQSGGGEYSQASVSPEDGTFVNVKRGTVSGSVTNPTQTPYAKNNENYGGQFSLKASVSIDFSFSLS